MRLREDVELTTATFFARSLAELSLKKAPGSAKAEDHSLKTEESSAAEIAKGVREVGKKQGALATMREGKAEEKGAALSAKVEDEVGAAKEMDGAVAPKAGEIEAREE